MLETDPYAAVATHLPNKIAVGGALITMVEPDPGFETAYNRWYEDSHFYFGAMVGPWFFAGRRWVATRDLLALRFPVDSPIVQPVTLGCYLAVYLTLAGHHEDALRCRHVAAMEFLHPLGRGFDQRRHAYTTSATYDFGVIREDEPYLQPYHVFDHPFTGLVLEIYRADDPARREEMLQRLEQGLQGTLSGSPIAAALAFTSQSFTSTNLPRGVDSAPEGAGSTVTVLSFLQADPRSCWSRFQRHQDLAASVGATLTFAAPFIPTVPGSDCYTSELRSSS